MKKTAGMILLCVLLPLILLTGCREKSTLDPRHPVTLSLWHIYGEQAESPMNVLVEEFNSTVGREKGVVVDVGLMSNVVEIGQKLLDAQNGVPGSAPLPDLFCGHASNVLALGEEKMLDWKEHFTPEQLDAYVDAFVQEGMVGEKLCVFPVSKSTHLLFINGTMFERFSAATGVSYEDLATWEGFFDAAEKFHAWSGGKAFCAFDFLMRAVELHAQGAGAVVMTEDGWYDFSSGALKESWMLFARPLAQGHIAVSDMYSNTQVMTGEVCAGVSSSAAILYYNDQVIYPDNTAEPVNLKVLPMPQTPGREPLITQAGAGLIAYKSTEQKAEAAAVFVRWLTEGERNLAFVTETGYMPVHSGAFEAIDSFTFEKPAYESLYGALKQSRETGVLTMEPSFAGYYDRIGRLYEALREQQPHLAQRALEGEDAQALAEETWQLFAAVQ